MPLRVGGGRKMSAALRFASKLALGFGLLICILGAGLIWFGDDLEKRARRRERAR